MSGNLKNAKINTKSTGTLAWALTKNGRVAWGVVFILAILLSLFVPGSIDVGLIHEFGGAFSAMHLASPLLVDLNRFLGWIVGAGLAAMIVSKRKRIGLEDDIRFKDFPWCRAVLHYARDGHHLRQA